MKFAAMIMIAICLLCGCSSASLETDTPAQPEPETTAPDWLADEELVMDTAERLWPVVFSGVTVEEGFASLTENQKVFFALNYLDMEVANGGLCQFFINDGDVFAPYISGYLEVVGAGEHQALFDSFVADNGIDTNDLSDFEFTSIENYVDQYNRYPFDEFDDAYYELGFLSSHLAQFIRSHPEDFWQQHNHVS